MGSLIPLPLAECWSQPLSSPMPTAAGRLAGQDSRNAEQHVLASLHVQLSP